MFFFNALANIAKIALTHWVGLAQIKAQSGIKVAEAKVTARLERIKSKTEAEIQWDLTQSEKVSWADELFTIVFVTWFVANFIPWVPLQEAIHAGHQRLATAPEFMLVGFGLCMAGAFGYRGFVEIMKRKK